MEAGSPSPKGWAGGDIDATTSSTASFALGARPPGSSSALPEESSGSVRVASMGAANMRVIEEHLKRERIYWSEQTLFTVQKVELTMKQDLQKAITALRRQVEAEREENQLRMSNLDKNISHLREELEDFRHEVAEQQTTNLKSEQLASLQLEFGALRCSMEDCHRQQCDEMSVSLANFESEAAQSKLSLRQLREDLALATSRTEEVEASMKSLISEAKAAVTSRMEEVEGSVQSLMSKELEEISGRIAATESSIKALGSEVTGQDSQQRISDLDKTLSQLHSEMGEIKQGVAQPLLESTVKALVTEALEERGVTAGHKESQLDVDKSLSQLQTEVEELKRLAAEQATCLHGEEWASVQYELDKLRSNIERSHQELGGDVSKSLSTFESNLAEMQLKVQQALEEMLTATTRVTEAESSLKATISQEIVGVMGRISTVESSMKGLVSEVLGELGNIATSHAENRTRLLDLDRCTGQLQKEVTELRLAAVQQQGFDGMKVHADQTFRQIREAMAGLAGELSEPELERPGGWQSSLGALTSAGPLSSPHKEEAMQFQQELLNQTSISEDLKDSLEKLVDRVNKMLKPGGGGGAGAPGGSQVGTPRRRNDRSRSIEPGQRAGSETPGRRFIGTPGTVSPANGRWLGQLQSGIPAVAVTSLPIAVSGGSFVAMGRHSTVAPPSSIQMGVQAVQVAHAAPPPGHLGDFQNPRLSIGAGAGPQPHRQVIQSPGPYPAQAMSTFQPVSVSMHVQGGPQVLQKTGSFNVAHMTVPTQGIMSSVAGVASAQVARNTSFAGL